MYVTTLHPPPFFTLPKSIAIELEGERPTRGEGRERKGGGAGTSQNTTAHPAYAIEQPEGPVDGQPV